jgi:hypothetical protein
MEQPLDNEQFRTSEVYPTYQLLTHQQVSGGTASCFRVHKIAHVS